MVVGSNKAYLVDTPVSAGDTKKLVNWLMERDTAIGGSVVTHFHHDSSAEIITGSISIFFNQYNCSRRNYPGKKTNGSLSEALSVPWWAWLGGFFWAFNIAISIYLAPKIGAVALAISVVCGQVIAAIFYDQYGLLGYPKREITPSRIFGAVFLVVGVLLVSKK